VHHTSRHTHNSIFTTNDNSVFTETTGVAHDFCPLQSISDNQVLAECNKLSDKFVNDTFVNYMGSINCGALKDARSYGTKVQHIFRAVGGYTELSRNSVALLIDNSLVNGSDINKTSAQTLRNCLFALLNSCTFVIAN